MKNPDCIYIPKEYFNYFKEFLNYAKNSNAWFNTYNLKIKTCLKLFLFSKILEVQGEKFNLSELEKEGDKVIVFIMLSNLTDDFLNYGSKNTLPEDYPDADLLLFINKRPLTQREVNLGIKDTFDNNIRINILPFNLKDDFKIDQKNIKTIGSQINYSKLKLMVDKNKDDLKTKDLSNEAIPLDYFKKFNKLITEFKEKNPYNKLDKSKKMDDFEINTLKAKRNFGSIDW